VFAFTSTLPIGTFDPSLNEYFHIQCQLTVPGLKVSSNWALVGVVSASQGPLYTSTFKDKFHVSHMIGVYSY